MTCPKCGAPMHGHPVRIEGKPATVYMCSNQTCGHLESKKAQKER